MPQSCLINLLILFIPIKMLIAQVVAVRLLSPVWLCPHGLQHTRLHCPSVSPGVCYNSCPLGWWCHPTISSLSSPPPSVLSLSQRQVFNNELALRIKWPKYWSFSCSMGPSNECSGLISFRIDWFDLLAVQGALKSLLRTTIQKHQFFSIQPFLWSHSHICTWLLEKSQPWLYLLR